MQQEREGGGRPAPNPDNRKGTILIEDKLQQFKDRDAVFISQDSGDIFIILPEKVEIETGRFFPIHEAAEAETATVSELLSRLDFEIYDEQPGLIVL